MEKTEIKASVLMTTLTADLVKAMRDKDTVKKGVLQLIKAGIQNEAIKIRSKLHRELTEQEELEVVARELKQTKDSMKEAEKLGRADVVKSAKEKVEIIEKYLPKQLDADEIKEQLTALGVTKDMNLGQVMKLAMPVLKGKADGSLINKTVQEFLQS